MRSTQEEIIIDKISRELSIGNNEKDLAYEIFLKKISSSLQYDETIKLPRIGLFQKKKGLYDGTNLIDNSFLNDTIIYSPFQNDKVSNNFAFLNIGIFNKPINNLDFDENIFSLSINKPVLKISTSSINQLDSTTSLLLLKKNIEDKVNQLIMASDFFEGINLWNDLIPSNELVEDEIKFDELPFISSESVKDDSIDSLGLESFLPVIEEHLIEETDINDKLTQKDLETENEVSIKANDDNLDLIDQIFNQNSKNDFNKTKLTQDITDFDIPFNVQEQFEDSTVQIDEDIDFSSSNLEIKDDIIEISDSNEPQIDPFELTSVGDLSSSNTNNELDWNKELEDELFAKNIQNDEEINLDFNSNDSKQDVSFNDNSEKEDDINLDFLKEQIENDSLIDFDNSTTEVKVDENIENIINESENNEEDDKLLLDNKSLDTNIDDLFESIDQKDALKQEPSKEKKPFFLSNKLLIILLSIFVTLAAAGGVYYFFFSHKSSEVKHENKVIKPSVEKKENKVEKKEKIMQDSTKTDTVAIEPKEISKVEPNKEISSSKKEESPKVETSKIEKSISNQTKQPEKVEQQKNVKFSTSDLYKKMSADKLVSEKIYFDGSKYNIQTSSWQSKYRAEAEVLKYRRKGFSAYVVEADLKTMGIWYRVKIFEFNTKADADSFIKKNNL